ncbi:MAG: type I restriction enzyme endonuclease domain-containing protein [Bacteroidota bacterium]
MACNFLQPKFTGKNKDLIVDYISIKKQMNLALAMYSAIDGQNMEEIEQSVVIVRDHLDLLREIFHGFDHGKFFHGPPLEQLDTLNRASEFVQTAPAKEARFMDLGNRLKAAYDICVGGDRLQGEERDLVIMMTKHGYPPVDRDEVRTEVFAQAAFSK